MNNSESPYDCVCTKSEIEIFATPPVNVSMEKGDYISHHPIATLTQNAPIEFHIPASTEEYIDLGRTQLYLQLRIINEDATHLVANAQVAPVNQIMHSLFSQVLHFFFFIKY